MPVKGSYAAVTVLRYGILAFRDAPESTLIHGVREDENGSTHVFASESVVLGCEIVSDVAPGKFVFVDENGRYFVEFVIQNPVSALYL